MKRRYIYRFLEFLLVGFLMGITEDLLAIHFATDAEITIHVIWVAAAVALPFAIFSEIIVDWGHVKYLKNKWEKKIISSKQVKNLKKNVKI